MPSLISRPEEWFTTVLKETIAEDPSKVAGFDGVLAFDITGDNGGKWLVTIREGAATVADWDGDKNEAGYRIKMRADNFVKMINGELSGPVAFMSGKLKFSGDLTQAIKLRKLLFS